jgi:PEGA domain-containing protein/PDZ domain-containing protein
MGNHRARTLALAPLLALAALVAFQFLSAQEAHKPLTEKQVIDLLTNDVPPPRVGELAQQYGITFVMTATTEQSLRDSGATDGLIATLRKIAPKTVSAPSASPPTASSSPPVLMIQSTPGEAQVYVDDEPIGTTSSEGRLKLSKLGAGEHHVRVAHAGYADFEQSVTLSSGPTTVEANLQASSAQSAPDSNAAGSNPPSQQANPTATGAPTAVLGALLRFPQNGAQGALVMGLVPGCAAERAGLRAGYTVISIGGRKITSTLDVQQSTAGRRPGDTVPVSFSDGSQVSTAQVALSSPTIFQTVPHFRVAHDHGPPAPNYCVGWMWIFDGMISYTGQIGINSGGNSGPKHNLEFETRRIHEVKKNGFYMAAYGAFHIRMKNGNVANFTVVDQQGRFQQPDELLTAADKVVSNE